MSYNNYDKIAHLPLFQGIGSKELLSAQCAVGLFEEMIKPGHVPFIRQNATTDYMILVISGKIKRVKSTRDGLIKVTTFPPIPRLIEADKLFGRNRSYEASYYACEETKVMLIYKNDFVNHFMKIDTFLINYLNTISCSRGNLYKLSETAIYGSILSRFKHLLAPMLYDEEGEARISTRMADLALYLNETRLSVSKMLNSLHQEGIITLTRNRIIIHDIQPFLQSKFLDYQTQNEHPTTA